MRHAFSDAIAEIMKKDDKIFLIVGDIGFGLFSGVPKNRMLNVGIAEQAMIGFAAGMALVGLKPYVYTITPFLVERPFEQVKLDVVQQNANVKLVGYCDYPTQGPTHAEVLTPEKMKLLFPSLNCYLPGNSKEVADIVKIEHSRVGPAFISLKKDK